MAHGGASHFARWLTHVTALEFWGPGESRRWTDAEVPEGIPTP